MSTSCCRERVRFSFVRVRPPSVFFSHPARGRLVIVALVFLCALGGLVPDQISAQNVTRVPSISTFAGTGTQCPAGSIAGCGDGGPATSAEFNNVGARLDRAGNLYISSAPNNVIWMVGSNGILTLVAGTGPSGYSGDGGPATSATLNLPHGTVKDNAGNLYIVDTGNNVIRKVDTNGNISTFAGTGVACTTTTSSTNPCGDGLPAISAQFHQPLSISIDSAGNLYIGDELDYRVRMIATNGTISTVVGTGISGYSPDSSSPGGSPATSSMVGVAGSVGLDSRGNLYFSDFIYNIIRKVDTSGNLTTVVGVESMTAGYSPDGTPATSASLDSPHDIVVDSLGNLTFEDAGNNVVRTLDSNGNLKTIVGSPTSPTACPVSTNSCGDGGPATSAQLNFPVTLVADNGGNLYIGDWSDYRIRKVVSGPVNFGPIQVGVSVSQTFYLSINNPLALTSVQTSGDYTVLSNSCAPTQPLTQLSAGTLCTLSVQFTPSQPGPRWAPLVLTDSNANNYSFGLEGAGVGSALAITPGLITSVAGSGQAGYNGENLPALTAELSGPQGIVLDSTGNIYFADWGNNRVRVVNTQTSPIIVAGVTIGAGNVFTIAGSATQGFAGDGGPALSAELYYPSGVALDGAGNVYIVDTDNFRVRKVDVNGVINTFAGSGGGGGCANATNNVGDGCPAVDAYLDPSDVAVDTAGNVYIADWGDARVRKVDLNGIITTVAGNGTSGYSGDGGLATSAQLNYACNLALDNLGDLYISDCASSVVRMVNPNGIISTVAGNGTTGFGGDGEPATSAELNGPRGLAVDSAGDLYIVDQGNDRIREVNATGTITTIAGIGSEGTSCSFGSYIYGDGCPATSAFLGSPYNATVDGAGDVYIADSEDNRIRKVSASSSVMQFGSVSYGQTSAPQNITLSDVGSMSLNFSLTTPFVTSPNFQLVNNNCAGSILPVSPCTLGVEFAPVSGSNPITGTLSISDGAFNSPQTVSLSGTALALTPTFSNLTPSQSIPAGTASIYLAGTLSSGSYYPSTTDSLTVTIDGTTYSAAIGSNGTFSLTFPTSTIPASTTPYTITYTFAGDTILAPVSNSSTSLTVQAPPANFTLTITNAYGTGSGIVTDSLQVLNCLDSLGVLSGTCSASYQTGTQVTLTATPTNSSTFGSWGGACAGTIPTCVLTMNAAAGVTVDFVAPPQSAQFTYNVGTNVTNSTLFCPSGSNCATDPNGNSFTAMIGSVTTSFGLTVAATEVDPNGLCPPNVAPGSNFNCRFLSFFNYGTDPTTGDYVVPLCFPYSNGNCVHYQLYLTATGPGTEPNPSWYSGGVYWKIGFNNSSYTPGSYWAGSTPRLLDDPDTNETPGLPYGTNCSTPMNMNGSSLTPPIYCQFDRDITTFYNPAAGLDATIGGRTKQTNDVVVAFLPTSTGSDPVAQPLSWSAPSFTGSCVQGCETSGNTIIFEVGTGATFAITTTGYPSPVLTGSGTLPTGLAFNGVTGVIAGTPAAGSAGSYSYTVTATNHNGTTAEVFSETYTILVSGLEIQPTSVNFGTLYLGQVAAQPVTLTNTGTSTITISKVNITAPGNATGDYGDLTLCPPLILALPAKLPAGKSCTIMVGALPTAKTFSPTASTATLAITDSTPGSPHLVPITAQVINPQATLSTYSLTFATQKVGTTSTAKSVTLTNTGNTPLVLGALTTSGNFELASGTTCTKGETIATGGSCSLYVTFTPTAKGKQTGNVTICDNALVNQQVLLLMGTGD